MKFGRSWVIWSVLCFGFAFLYIPIFSLIAYSFNASRLVTVWGGFSIRWYGALFENEQLMTAVWLSLRIAVVSSSVAVVLGTLVGLAMARFGRFRGRSLLSGLIAAPMVVPEVVMGLSLLLLFVSLASWIGWPMTRGVTTITIAHITFSMAYCAVIVQSRLVGLDRSVEEAAMDLGARPVTVFFRVTLPIISPALVAGWLLSFTMSLDDVVIASFVSGPGASTLPMVVFSKVRLGVSPDINALASIIVLVVSLGVFVSGLFLVRKQRRFKTDRAFLAVAQD